MFVLAASIISVARVLKRGVKHLMSLLSLENTERGEIKRKSSLCQKSDGQVRSANFVAPCPSHFEIDHNDPSKPSHRLTNGPEPSKTIDSDGSNIKNHRKTIDGNGQTAQKTFNGDGLLKNH